MRLLLADGKGGFRFTGDLADGEVPRYAVLSHRWLAPVEEPTLEDILHGWGNEKPGYRKLEFCAKQAAVDGLQYFWVDTCCIDKANKAELSISINSMFRWYQNAAICYVFLADVPSKQFTESEWFKRGWTLQELLGPRSVVFYSGDGKRLGDKDSLSQAIHESTNIPQSALNERPLYQFSENERFSWMAGRETALEEDRVYSLLGIFDVYIAPMYSEGFAQALQRLRDELKRRGDCVRDLRVTDPRNDRKRIVDTKGGILVDCYRWILDSPEFVRWRASKQSELLWIKGDPGKGKTMLICGIIDELIDGMSTIDRLSYFFCQASDSRINNATGVLRGLISLLVEQQPSLASHAVEKYEQDGKTLFEDANAWIALSEIFRNILQDPALKTVHLLVDALDECITGREMLLDFIGETTGTSSCVKWIVSSRSWPDIEEQLERTGYGAALCLNSKAETVSEAVRVFIRHKVDKLSAQKKYDIDTRDKVVRHLDSKANDTFLWVALVCQSLAKIPRWNTLAKLREFPPGLNAFYMRMWEHIGEVDDANLCRQILATTAVVYRPLTLDELTSIVEPLQPLSNDLAAVRELVASCGSFLTVREDTVYFVHQSAKDFLLTVVPKQLFPQGQEEIHKNIFSISLRTLSSTLVPDIYGLFAPGYAIQNVRPPTPDPLARSRYSCIYWISHLCAFVSDKSVDRDDTRRNDARAIEDFLEDFLRSKYLYWLECLSLCQGISEGVFLMSKLQILLEATIGPSALLDLVRDASRYIMYHKQAIEDYPLQVYVSALLFSPQSSLVRNCFKDQEPTWIAIKPVVEKYWNACLQTLEGHWSGVYSVAFSPDMSRLASASDDRTVKIWNASSGKCVQTLNEHSGAITSVVFSTDSSRLVSTSDDRTVKIWDVSSGKCIQTLEGHSDYVSSAVFSADSSHLASASNDKTVKIWDASRGRCVRTLDGHGDWVSSVVFSNDWSRLASASADSTIKIWDASNGACVQTLEGHSDYVSSVVFSTDSCRLASASRDNTVRLWDANSGKPLQTLKGHRDWVRSVVFSADSSRLASASDDRTVKIWDASSGSCVQTLQGHSHNVRSVVFSADSSRLASASDDNTVKIWDASSGKCGQTLEEHSDAITSVVFSIDSSRLASASTDCTIKIWSTSSGECVQTLKGHSDDISSMAFFTDSLRLASASWDDTVKIWDASSGRCWQTIQIGKALHYISFNASGLCLDTEVGPLALEVSEIPRTRIRTDNTQDQEYQNAGVTVDGMWITLNSQKVVWLPSDRRPSCSATSAGTVGIGCGSGKVWICSFITYDETRARLWL